MFVVPGKDNRDNYVANVHKLLVDQGMDGDAARMVFDLPRAGEISCVGLRLRAAKGAVGVRDIPCPIEARQRELSSHH